MTPIETNTQRVIRYLPKNVCLSVTKLTKKLDEVRDIERSCAIVLKELTRSIKLLLLKRRKFILKRNRWRIYEKTTKSFRHH